ncbi:hypothetical protein N9O26_02275 [Flavobacteriaceae bacterium]|nr:hypothetical protein [Flavobacteriaceae bacterium]
MSNHTFWLRFNFPKKDIESPQRVIIYYKNPNGTKKQIKTDYFVAPIHWDSKEKMIHKQYVHLYPHEFDQLTDIKRNYALLISQLNKGDIDYNTAFEKLTFKRDLSKSIREFLERSSYSRQSKRSYLDQLAGIEKHLKTKDLPVSVLNDRVQLEKISRKLQESPLGNGAWNYMNALRNWSNSHGFDTELLYKSIIPQKRDSFKFPISPKKFKTSFNEINTVTQLSAYLYWLYSFCLKGMTGNDIPNLEKKWLEFEGLDDTLNHYHQFGFIIKSDDPSIPNFNTKVNYWLYRGKKGTQLKGVYNLFPVLLIQKWLKHCLSISHSKYAYKGDDPIRLFNFKTKDDNGNMIPEGVEKWDKIRNTFYHIYKKKFNGALHQTRHTYTEQQIRLGHSDSEQRRDKGHKPIGSLKNYSQGTGQIVSDEIRQISVNDSFGVDRMVEMLLKSFLGKKDILGEPYSNKEIEKEYWIFKALRKLEVNDQWSKEDNFNYHKLLDNLMHTGVDYLNKETGIWVTRDPVESDFTGRLAILHNRQKELVKSGGFKFVKPTKGGSIAIEFENPDWVEPGGLSTKDSITTLLNLKEAIENGVIQGDLEWVDQQLDIINSKAIEKLIK